MRRPQKRPPPVNLARNVLHGGTGGILAGALVGLTEALWLLATAGAPDLLSPFYAVVLYGLLALPFGIGAGVVLAAFEKVRGGGTSDGFAWAFGFAGGASPLLLFVLHYLGNKVIYLERGVPPAGLLAILGIVGAFALASLLGLPRLLRGPLWVLLRARGLALGWGGLAAVTGAVALLGSLGGGEDYAHDKPVPEGLADAPNVLVILADTLRADHLGTYGLPGDPTPAIDQLGADGIVYEQAFVPASWTRPAMASMLSSRLPSGHNADTKASRLSEEVVTYPEVLQAAGITTGALMNNINVTATFGFDQGYDTFVYLAPSYRFWASESVFGLTFYKVVHRLGEMLLPGPKRVEQYYQPADVVLAEARGFIEANRDSRWALFVQLMEPHDPYFEHPSVDGTGAADYNGVGFARAEFQHPHPDQAEYMKRIYRDEVVFMDRQLAPFLDWLRRDGLYDDTLIVFLSDHGEEFYEHEGWWHGMTLYEEQLHIPLLVKLPGNEEAGTRVPWQVRAIDLPPTLATAVGLEPDPTWEGTDLLAGVREEAREAVAAHTLDPDEIERVDLETVEARGHPRDRLVVAEQDFEGNILAAVRSEGFKYLRANEGNPRGLPTEELFDLLADPGEQQNLLGTGRAIDGVFPEDRAEMLSEALLQVLTASGEAAIEAGTAVLSPAECERLQALGYLSADEDCG